MSKDPTAPLLPLAYETAVSHRGKPLVIELHAGYMHIEPKGSRHGYDVAYQTIYERAAAAAAERSRAERAIATRRRRR